MRGGPESHDGLPFLATRIRFRNIGVPSLAHATFSGWKTTFKGVGFDYITIGKPDRDENGPDAAPGLTGTAQILCFRSGLRNLG
jgi:hypothetical protein